MIFAIFSLALLLTVTTVISYISVKKNLEFLDQQEEMLELLESSLQDLEVCHKKLDKKVKLELFSDDHIVKELVDDMKLARQTVSSIIEKLTNEKDTIRDVDKVESNNA